MKTEQTSRELFEAFVASSPYEYEVLRYPDDKTKNAWPGQYRSMGVQLAWEAWEESRRLMMQQTK